MKREIIIIQHSTNYEIYIKSYCDDSFHHYIRFKISNILSVYYWKDKNIFIKPLFNKIILWKQYIYIVKNCYSGISDKILLRVFKKYGKSVYYLLAGIIYCLPSSSSSSSELLKLMFTANQCSFLFLSCSCTIHFTSENTYIVHHFFFSHFVTKRSPVITQKL